MQWNHDKFTRSWFLGQYILCIKQAGDNLAAAEVIVDALKEHKSEFGHGGMTRQDLRDAARMHIGDTGLLYYVLKSMNNVIVGNHIVRHAINTSRILKYTIDEVDNGVKGPEAELEIHQKPLPDALPAIMPGIVV